MKKIFPALFRKWTWQMAWRDSRASRRRLILFSWSIVMGIAAVVAIGGFEHNLKLNIAHQAKSLLGADLVVHSRDQFTPEAEALLKSLGGEQASEISFASMVYFPKTEGSRLVQVRALEGGFPFYGAIETDPPQAAAQFRLGSAAVLEEALLAQFGAAPGEPVRIGKTMFTIAGVLRKVPGETVAFSTIAPRVYISMKDLPATGLIRDDSFARFKRYYKFPETTDVEALVKKLEPKLLSLRLGTDTVEERKEDLGRSVENLSHFLNLGAMAALLLGGIGVASAIHVHVKSKLSTVAVLRCLGLSAGETFAVYLAQALALGLLGAMAGACLGLAVQKALPLVVADFVAVEITSGFSWSAMLQGIGLGFAVCILFALLPLLPMRLISPLASLRASFEEVRLARHDPARWALLAIMAVGLIAFAVAQTRRWQQGLGFALGLLAAILALTVTGLLLMYAARRLVAPALPYVWRQGLANLHRPNNRTTLLMMSLGLGAFLILTLFLCQRSLGTQIIPADQPTQPNAVLFDIQTDQRDEVAAILRKHGLPILQEAPIVTMRISKVKERKVDALLKDPNRRTPNWVLRREYRSSYRNRLVDSEELVAGQWPPPRVDAEPYPISLESGIAEELQVKLGDEIEFDIQGVPMKTKIASLRKVEWRRLQPNFFVIFPDGVLEQAPSFHIMATRAQTPAQSAQMQRDVVRQFPNVSSIDLSLILETVQNILSKIAGVIHFMALFTIGAGLLVLIGSLLSGRFQRIQESVLLRTLGASTSQIRKILLLEYIALGFFAALAGTMLAYAASWTLARYLFRIEFVWELWSAPAAIAAVSGVSLIAGLLTNRGVSSHPPLEVLRKESF